MKTCSRCGESKPLDAFYQHSRPSGTYVWRYCKLCHGIDTKRWRAANLARHTAGTVRARRARQIGISVAAYNDWREPTACEACGADANSPRHGRRFNPHTRRLEAQRLAIDHDHRTQKFRGFLCSACNRALGIMADDPELLRALALYNENAAAREAFSA